VLVDGAVHVPPDAVDLDVGFVDVPPVAGCVPAPPGRVSQQRGEALDPPEDSDVVGLNAPLDKEFFDIAVGKGCSADTAGPRPRSRPVGTGTQRTPTVVVGLDAVGPRVSPFKPARPRQRSTQRTPLLLVTHDRRMLEAVHTIRHLDVAEGTVTG
jgi:hypothetical protein